MKALKIALVVSFLVIATYLTVLYIQVMDFMETYEYGFNFRKIDSAKIGNLLQLGTNESWVEIQVDIIIDNKSDFSITLKDTEIDFYYENIFIGSGKSTMSNNTLYKRTASTIPVKGKLYMNKAAMNFMSQVYKGKDTQFVYDIKTKVGFLPFRLHYKNTYTYNAKSEVKKELETKLPQIQSVLN